MKSCIIGKHLCKKVLFCYGKKEVARYEPQATAVELAQLGGEG